MPAADAGPRSGIIEKPVLFHVAVPTYLRFSRQAPMSIIPMKKLSKTYSFQSGPQVQFLDAATAISTSPLFKPSFNAVTQIRP
jgi:hypothetical protein